MDLHEFGFTRGRTKIGGEEGMQSKGYICTCPVVFHRFVDICQQVFGLFFTYDTTCNLLVGICNHQRKRMWLGGGRGGGVQLLPEGWHFICHGGGRGEAGPPPPPPPPTPKAMLDLGLHGIYLELL